MHNIKYLVIALLFLSITVSAQESRQFTIEGKVRKPLTIALNNLTACKSINLESMTISTTSHYIKMASYR
jgi:hypothetical protein